MASVKKPEDLGAFGEKLTLWELFLCVVWWLYVFLRRLAVRVGAWAVDNVQESLRRERVSEGDSFGAG
jgi:hypothetical protein